MAKEEKLEEILKDDAVPAKKEKSKGLNSKVFIIGIPAFIVQLVAVYFVVGYVLTSKIQPNAGGEAVRTTEEGTKKGGGKTDEAQSANFIYSIEDIVVNPADTDGKRLLLLSLGITVKSEEDRVEMQTKEVLVKDAIISTISSKNLVQLNSTGFKDSLKIELTNRIRNIFPKVHLHQVYFSKFILQ